MKLSLRHPAVWIALGGLWLGGVVVGLATLMDYDNRPGLAADAPPEWPANSRLTPDPAGPTLVMLAHPRCDCTRASISELAELMARARQRPRAYVVFIRPGRVPGDWENTSLWQSAMGIPGVTVLRDDQGEEARRFGVQTSGQVLVYNAHGRLAYSGGTTGSRGKTGSNVGRAAVLTALAGDHGPTTSPVFGCSMFGPADAPPERPHAHDSLAR